MKNTAALLTSESLNVHNILANEHRALILGDLASVVKAKGKRIETSFVLVLGIGDGLITSFRMLEDRFTVSRAVRGESFVLILRHMEMSEKLHSAPHSPWRFTVNFFEFFAESRLGLIPDLGSNVAQTQM